MKFKNEELIVQTHIWHEQERYLIYNPSLGYYNHAYDTWYHDACACAQLDNPYFYYTDSKDAYNDRIMLLSGEWTE
jgi:hypothetical protein